MPRSRRRHHSRSRSRSNSPDRDREPKRRKVESFESPHNRRSVSSEPEANESVEKALALNDPIENIDAHSSSISPKQSQIAPATDAEQSEQMDRTIDLDKTQNSDSDSSLSEDSHETQEKETNLDVSVTDINAVAQTLLKDKSSITTPQKPLTPKQMQKKLESDKKKAERQRERDERKLEQQKVRDEKLRQKQLEKDVRDAKAKEEREAKQREKDLKDKEREAKRKEKEEKEEKKEAERLKKLAEVEEKNREKQKMEEKKLKAAAAFTKFFVPKTGNEIKKDKLEEGVQNNLFMPFQLKSDMRLAPTTRNTLSDKDKTQLIEIMSEQDYTGKYLVHLKSSGRKTGKLIWAVEESSTDDDVAIVEKPSSSLIKAKFLKFHENRRPAFYGTWRKKSKTINGRKPLAQDKIFNYEIDSDDEWEEEEEGEDIAGSDDEEKEPDSENDYEVDDEFFVPHGHLSDDEGHDEEESIAPEMRKAKEKLLKNQFDEERKLKTKKIKPRVIGCIWYNNNNNEDGAVDAAIDTFLKPYSILCNNVVEIKKRSEFEVKERHKWKLAKEHMPDLLRLLHGNVNNKRVLTTEFFQFLEKKNTPVVVNKMGLGKLIKSIAKWRRCKQEGAMFNKVCWVVNEDTITEYNHVCFKMPNDWQYCTSVETNEA